MFQSWRLRIREADEAFRDGRLDEAQELLVQGDLLQYLPGKRLAEKVAKGLAERARGRVFGGQSNAGWSDLSEACDLAAGAKSVKAIRGEILEQAITEAEGRIVAGEPSQAVRRLESLEKHGQADLRIRHLKEAAARLESARNLQVKGKFREAASQLERAAILRPGWDVIQRLQADCRDDMEMYQRRSEELHKAMSEESWSDVLSLADRLLEVAPDSPLATDARRRAWGMVGAKGESPDSGNVLVDSSPTRRTAIEKRAMLWIDGVGGYLLCLEPTVTIGQATPGNHVDIAIFGDLSREHVRIRRDDGYLLEPIGAVRQDGNLVNNVTLLSDGDEFEIGSGIRLRFRQSHALSATARLDIVSSHRTKPSVDGILLMAESCVMGPKLQNHVICRDWANDVVLYRMDGELGCRALESLEIDGCYCEGQGRLGFDSHVCGSDFSLGIERIG